MQTAFSDMWYNVFDPKEGENWGRNFLKSVLQGWLRAVSQIGGVMMNSIMDSMFTSMTGGTGMRDTLMKYLMPILMPAGGAPAGFGDRPAGMEGPSLPGGFFSGGGGGGGMLSGISKWISGLFSGKSGASEAAVNSPVESATGGAGGWVQSQVQAEVVRLGKMIAPNTPIITSNKLRPEAAANWTYGQNAYSPMNPEQTGSAYGQITLAPGEESSLAHEFAHVLQTATGIGIRKGDPTVGPYKMGQVPGIVTEGAGDVLGGTKGYLPNMSLGEISQANAVAEMTLAAAKEMADAGKTLPAYEANIFDKMNGLVLKALSPMRSLANGPPAGMEGPSLPGGGFYSGGTGDFTEATAGMDEAFRYSVENASDSFITDITDGISDIQAPLSDALQAPLPGLFSSMQTGFMGVIQSFGKWLTSAVQSAMSGIGIGGGGGGGGGGGIGGWLSGLFGGGTGAGGGAEATSFFGDLVSGMGFAKGGIVPGMMHAARGGIVPGMMTLALAGGGYSPKTGFSGMVNKPMTAITMGENAPSQFEAVVPLPDNRSIPVSFTGRGGSGGGGQTVVNPPPVIIETHFHNPIDPASMKTTYAELVQTFRKDKKVGGDLHTIVKGIK
jgi:hypothetical protein